MLYYKKSIFPEDICEEFKLLLVKETELKRFNFYKAIFLEGLLPMPNI